MSNLQPHEYADRSDEELMGLYQGGDDHAFEILLHRHQGGVYNFLYRFLGNTEHVEESFQEVFVRVIRASAKYQPSAKFSTWLYTIVRNFCLDELRKKKHRKLVSLSESSSSTDGESTYSLEDRLADQKAGPDKEVAAMHLSQKLEQALDMMNPDQREVFLLREKMGLSFDEIATIVDSSVNTVKSRMRYAVTQLQETCKSLGIYKSF